MARAPRHLIERELAEVQALISEHPEGLAVTELVDEYTRRYPGQIAKRTLNRRLDELVREGRIIARGATARRIYLPNEAESTGSAGLDTSFARPIVAEENYVPLSEGGAEVRRLVRRHIMHREPVGYERGFLEGYEPGVTWYLPEDVRRQLHEMGLTPDPHRPAGTFARDIFDRLLIDLAWASSKLEGNTYTRLDTQNLIQFGLRAEGEDAENTQMILNHKTAIELLVDSAEIIGFDRRTLTTLHSALAENLLGDPGEEGRLRRRPVQITGTRYTPVAIPQVIEDTFDLLLEKAAAIPDPFEQAFFAMVQIPYLQPFSDVNKRTSRLAANIPLIRENLCPLSFVDVPERAYVEGTLGIYELQRVELLRDVFVWAYARSCAQYKIVRDSLVQPDPLRLKYRNELTAVVREIVLAMQPPREDLVRAHASQRGIPEEEVDGFTQWAISLLNAINEGSAGRYHLRPSEFAEWQAKHRNR
ncbi:MAG TPA: Fic family protein [Longimicrobium sp.]|jgi:fido (protein-threonine AMPylation protein)